MTERPVGEVAAASVLEAEPEAVWAWVTTPEGITAELMPLMRTTVPDGLSPLDLDSIELGKPIGRSWVLLFGFLPIDCDEIKLVELSPPRGFVERGRLLSQRYWRHERTIEPLEDGGCVLTDRVAWRPRLPVPPGTLTPGFRASFRHRHRRLRDHFGGRPAAPATD
jgi:ligand-binding SRPBCC domain-containing protein